MRRTTTAQAVQEGRTVQRKKLPMYRSKLIQCSSDQSVSDEEEKQNKVMAIKPKQQKKQVNKSNGLQEQYSTLSLDENSLSWENRMRGYEQQVQRLGRESERLGRENERLRQVNSNLMVELKSVNQTSEERSTQLTLYEQKINQLEDAVSECHTRNKQLTKKVKNTEKQCENKLLNQQLAFQRMPNDFKFSTQMKLKFKTLIGDFIGKLQQWKILPQVETIIEAFCSELLQMSSSSSNYNSTKAQVNIHLHDHPNTHISNGAPSLHRSVSPLKVSEVTYNRVDRSIRVAPREELADYRLLQESITNLKRNAQRSMEKRLDLSSQCISNTSEISCVESSTNCKPERSKSQRKKIFG